LNISHRNGPSSGSQFNIGSATNIQEQHDANRADTEWPVCHAAQRDRHPRVPSGVVSLDLRDLLPQSSFVHAIVRPVPINHHPLALFPGWFEALCTMSLVAGVLCAVTVAIDLSRRPTGMPVMRIVWPVAALFGHLPLVWFYVHHGRTSRRYAVIVAKGTLHCGAGCAIGDIVAESLAYAAPTVAVAFGWHSWFQQKIYAVWVLDFVLAFAVGILFQYFAIVPMRKLTPSQGIVAAFKADTLSLTAWQVGMYGLMAVMQFIVFPHAFRGRAPVNSVEFWAAMQLAMLAGFATSFPMNWWLIRVGIKERM
jgi:hypothetical protein